MSAEHAIPGPRLTAKKSGATHARFRLLDGLRGVAALIVVAYHMGERADLAFLVPRGYLAVDFFYVLSGFVIANAYGERLRGAFTGAAFLKMRLIRLLPMLVPGTLFGAVIEFGRPGTGHALLHRIEVPIAAILGCLSIPMPINLTMEQTIFPINGSVWSMFFEIVVNVVFFMVAIRSEWRRLSFALMILGGLGLAIYAVQTGTVNGGFLLTDWPIGFPRVSYSFFAGVLLSSWRSKVPLLPVWVYPVLLICVLSIPADKSLWSAALDLAAVLIVFPAMVASGAGTTLKPGLSRLCDIAGDISYPVYALHYPVARAVCFLMMRHPPTMPARLSIIGATMLAMSCVAWFALKFYDEPIRRWLTRRFNNRTRAPDVGVAALRASKIG